MTNQDTKICFHTGIAFEDTAMLLWAAVQMDIEPAKLNDFILGENAIYNSNRLTVEEKLVAFDFLAETNERRTEVLQKTAAATIGGTRDLMLCWLVVAGVVQRGFTKTEAIEFAVQAYGRAKAERRDKPEVFHMFKIANNRQIEDRWAKYRPVLHYAEAAAFAFYGDELVDFGLLRSADCSPQQLECRANATLVTLRAKGLVKEALIICRGSQSARPSV